MAQGWQSVSAARRRVAIAGLASVLLLGAASLELRHVGPEFRVNELTAHIQQRPRVAYLGRGRSVVTWDESSRVFMRLVSAGSGIGPDVQVAAGRPWHSHPDVCALPGGRFVLVWGVDLSLVGPRSAVARLFDRDGVALTDPIHVGQGGSTDGPPRVACQGRAGFVVAWIDADREQRGIFARVFDRSGVALGERFLVNTYETGDQRQPAVAAFPQGGFLVVWQGRSQEDSLDVSLRRFQADGTPTGPETRVHRETSGSQSSPAVAASASGRYAVVWEEFGRDGERFGIFGAVSQPRTGALGPEFQVNVHTAGDQAAPQIRYGDPLSFLVTWQSAFGQDGSDHGIFARAFHGSGQRASEEVQVNTYWLSRQRRPALTRARGGSEFLLVWDSYLQDGSVEGVYGQSIELRRRR